jgi:hypothetical protein
MNYAINWFKGFAYEDEVQEIIIKYDPYEYDTLVSSPSVLIDFVKSKREDLRIVIDIADIDILSFNTTVDIFKTCYKIHPNIVFVISRVTNGVRPNILMMKKHELPFFFREGADTIDKLNQYISEGVTDVYITNELAFSLSDIKYNICKNRVKIRVYPNIAQSSVPVANGIKSITKFFIRPEDVKYYEDCVDVMEFFGSADKQNTLYKIYKEQKWRGPLNLIISGYNPEDNIEINSSIIPTFGQVRKNCHKKCGYTSSGCQICITAEHVARSLAEKGLEYKEKRKEDIDDKE